MNTPEQWQEIIEKAIGYKKTGNVFIKIIPDIYLPSDNVVLFASPENANKFCEYFQEKFGERKS